MKSHKAVVQEMHGVGSKCRHEVYMLMLNPHIANLCDKYTIKVLVKIEQRRSIVFIVNCNCFVF